MKFFFILMIMVQNTPVQDNLYLIEDPKFSTVNECLYFVDRNYWALQSLQKKNFPLQEIENVYCLSKKALDDLIKDRTDSSI